MLPVPLELLTPQLLDELEKPLCQVIRPGPFTLKDIDWAGELVQHGTGLFPKDKAFIPTDRLADLLSGIQNNHEFTLVVHDSKKNSEGTLRRPTCDSFLLRQQFCCCYGPEDQRSASAQIQDPAAKPKTGKGSRRARTALGEGIKRGCQYSFSAKKLYKWPDVTELTLHADEHLDRNGLPCHGAQDSSAAQTRAALAPHLSGQMRDWVANELRLGRPVAGIMSLHSKQLAAKIKEGKRPCR